METNCASCKKWFDKFVHIDRIEYVLEYLGRIFNDPLHKRQVLLYVGMYTHTHTKEYTGNDHKEICQNINNNCLRVMAL